MLFTRKTQSRSTPAPEPSITPPRPAPVDEQTGHTGPDGAPKPSFIDASLTITGDLHSEGDLQVDGRICGNVSCAQLIVGKDAAITGSVRAEQAIVRGSITGAIRAPVVVLQETAHVESEITYTLLTIDDGAMFEGAVHRSASPLEEMEGRSPLLELQRLMTVERSSTATGTASHGREASLDDAPGTSPPEPGRRTANGRADAQE